MILFLVEILDKSRFTPYVASLIGGGELIERVTPHCAATTNLHFRFPFDPFGFWQLVRFIRRNRIELVQTYGLRADTVGRIAAKLGGARVIVSSIRSIDPWRRWHHTLLDRLTAPLVDFYIANSEAGKRATIEREKFSPDKIHVVYSGIPERPAPAETREQILPEFGVPPDAFPVVGVLANLREMKGHRDIIDALPAIRGKLPKVLFLFAGRDDSGGEIERLARERGVGDSIRFPGYVRDTPRLLVAMDIFMLPSHWEGLPASVIEAMHAGKPIITTRVGGIPELVSDQETGILIEPAKPDQIANAVIQLSKDCGLRDRIGAAAKKRARTEFSIRAMLEQTQRLYENALSKK